MADLQCLHKILNINECAGTELRVHRAWLNELFNLQPAHALKTSQVKRLRTIDETVTMCLDLAPQRVVVAQHAELDQGLPLIPPGRTPGAIVVEERGKRSGRSAGAAV